MPPQKKKKKQTGDEFIKAREKEKNRLKARDKTLTDKGATAKQEEVAGARLAREDKPQERTVEEVNRVAEAEVKKGEPQATPSLASKIVGGVKDVLGPVGPFKEAAEQGELIQGTAPIGLGAGAAGAVFTRGGQASGLPGGVVKAAQILGGPAGGTITKGAGRSIVSKTTLSVAGSIAGGSGIMTWLASDNIISGMNIFTRDTTQAVSRGQLDPSEALQRFDEAQEFVDGARSFINTNTMVNPLLWPFRKILMTNADAAQLVLDSNRETIIQG